MASEKPEKEKKKDKKDKKEKKEKKEKRSDEDGVKKVKSDKDKKEKKKKHKETEAALEHATQDAASLPIRSANESDDEDAMEVDVAERVVPTSALVPFANPLADEKQHKKLLKAVKKGTFQTTRINGI
jgi:H/ACA ribonucleoprotein complex subunit 2